MSLAIDQFTYNQDNYGVLLHDGETGETALIDAGDAKAALSALETNGWELTQIWITHHHGDHTGANLELKAAYGLTIVGAGHDAARIPGIDVRVGGGDSYDFAGHRAQVMAVPGHTTGHIAYYFADSDALFCGDTLFALGCGRVFEGTMDQMWRSLSALRALPDDTRVYCAHEYTQANARFALSVDGDNPALVQRAAEIDSLRAAGRPTVPSALGEEKRTNPFLRADDPALAAAVGLAAADPVAVFAEVRGLKDRF